MRAVFRQPWLSTPGIARARMVQDMRLRTKADCTASDKYPSPEYAPYTLYELQGKQEGAQGQEPSQQTEAQAKQETPETKYHRCTCCSRLL